MSTPAAFEPRAAAPLTAAASPVKFPDARYSNAGAYFTE
jgi:hypothetical protein